MPSSGPSYQFAQIFWTPAYNLLEYQCTYCLGSFLNNYDCLAHFKSCPKNHKYKIDNFPEPRKFELAHPPAYIVKEHPDIQHKKDESIQSETFSELEEFKQSFASHTVVAIKEEPELEIVHTELPDLDEIGVKCKSPTTVVNKNETQKQRKPLISTSAKRMRNRQTKNNLAFFKQLQCTKIDLVCDICGINKNKRRYMASHMKSTHVAFICSFCGKKFQTISSHDLHLRSHTGEKPFTCNMCDKSFSRGIDLEYHMRNHTGDKPYTCTMCPKTYVNANSLNKHHKTHAKPCIYRCSFCDKTYQSNSSLKIHLKTHTETPIHECDICKQTFMERFQIKMHMTKHSGIKPFGCSMCDKFFRSIQARYMHVRKFHRPND